MSFCQAPDDIIKYRYTESHTLNKARHLFCWCVVSEAAKKIIARQAIKKKLISYIMSVTILPVCLLYPHLLKIKIPKKTSYFEVSNFTIFSGLISFSSSVRFVFFQVSPKTPPHLKWKSSRHLVYITSGFSVYSILGSSIVCNTIIKGSVEYW